jgi:multicomponent Na+:H+ antiporter subunit D
MSNLIHFNSPALIPILMLASAMLLPLIAIRRPKFAYGFTQFVLLVTFSISIYNIFRVLNEGPIMYRFGGWLPPIGIEYVLDHLSAFMALVINGIAFWVVMHSKESVAHEIGEKGTPYYALVILMLCGFNGIIVTGDLFNLYVFLEICSLAMYGLIACGEKKSPVAAFRYLIMGAMGATLYLLGIGFLFTVTGSLNMADTQAILPHVIDRPSVWIGFILMVLGIGLKMALFPLHSWLPDSYTYAPSTSSALIAPTGTKVAAYVLIRLIFFIFGVEVIRDHIPILTIIAILSACGIIVGSVMAIAQKEIKRMLAYSSVAQIGYIGLGIGLATPYGLIGALLHVMNHALMKGLLFLVTANFRRKLGHSDLDRLDNQTRRKMPWTSAAFAVAALSMVGIPPTVGFFSKWYLVLGTIQSRQWIFLVAILISSLLNAVYFFRVLERIYMKPIKGDAPAEVTGSSEVVPSMLVPTLVLALAVLVVGIFNMALVTQVLQKIVPSGL